MSSTLTAYVILILVAVQRVGELVIARRNTARLLQSGGVEVGARHYPLFVVLHGTWLVALLIWVGVTGPPISWPLIGIFVVLQPGRVWVLMTLGPYWTTRIITVPDKPLIATGPYRFVRHPNYWVVVGEIAVLPLAFGAWQIAVIYSLLNALLLRHRIRVEDAVLTDRR